MLFWWAIKDEHVYEKLVSEADFHSFQINYGMLLLSILCWCFTVLRVFNTIPDFCWFTFSCLYILFGVQIGKYLLDLYVISTLIDKDTTLFLFNSCFKM